MEVTTSKKFETKIFIKDGFYRNYNYIVKVKNGKYIAVSYMTNDQMPLSLTSEIKIGDQSSFYIQQEGLKPATEQEFKEAFNKVIEQTTEVL